MARKPSHLLATAARPQGRDVIWAAIRKLRQFTLLELEHNFAMYTGLLGIAKKWQASLKEEDVEDKKTAHWLISRVETWIAEVNKNVVERAWKSEVTQMIQRDVTAAIGKLD